MSLIQLICREWVGNSGLSESDERPTCLSDKEKKIISVYWGESSSDKIRGGGPSSYVVCPPPPFTSPVPSILYYFPPISTVHIQIQIYGADTCPISPSPNFGVVVKARKQGSINCRTLNALAATFSQIFPCLSLSFSFLILILQWSDASLSDG